MSPRSNISEPPYVTDQALYQWMLDIHNNVYGLGGDKTGILDRDNLSGEVPVTTEVTTISGVWTFTNVNIGTVLSGTWQGGVIDQAYLDVNLLLQDGSRPLTANWDAGSFKITAQQLESDIATGTAPFIVASTTLVTNLNADLWDGYQFADYFNQALLTTSSPTLNGLTVTSITIGANTLNTSEWAYLDGQNQSVFTTSSPTFANLILTSGGDIRPSANSTTALNIAQADGTNFVTFDTTNKRVSIGSMQNATLTLQQDITLDSYAMLYILPTFSPSNGDNLNAIQGQINFEGSSWVAGSSVRALNFLTSVNTTNSVGSTDLTVIGIDIGNNSTDANLTIKDGIGMRISPYSIGDDMGTGNLTATSLYGIKINEISISSGTLTATNNYGVYIANSAASYSITNGYSMYIEKQVVATNNYGIVLAGDGIGADLVLGAGKDAKIYYDGTDLVIDPDVVGTGVVNVAQTGTALGTVLAIIGNIPTGITATQNQWLKIKVAGNIRYIPLWA